MKDTITTPAYREEIEALGRSLLADGLALYELSESLLAVERATGQRLAVVSADRIAADATVEVPPMAETVSDDTPGLVDVDDSGLKADPAPLAADPEPPAPPPPAPQVKIVAGQEDAARAGMPWTDAEKARAIAMKGEGLTARHIAGILNRPVFATRHMLGKLVKEGAEVGRVDDAAPEPVPADQEGPKDDEPDEAEPAQEPAAPRRLTGRQQRLVDHLGRLGDDFEPSDDLWLAESLAKGINLSVIADQLGCDLATARGRYRAMLVTEIRSPSGSITIDGQADLLAALRYRAAE